MTHDATNDHEPNAGAGSGPAEPTTNRMGDVDHTHPHRNTTFGSVFGRGPTVAADGGRPAAASQSRDSIADVEHESPTDADASGAFERGPSTQATGDETRVASDETRTASDDPRGASDE